MIPMGSTYGTFSYIYHKNQPDVGRYTIHGSYGYDTVDGRNPKPPGMYKIPVNNGISTTKLPQLG